MRFRRELVAHGLDRNLFEAIALDLESKGACVRKGTSPQSLTAIASLIDATIIGTASKGDKEAAWVKHRTRPPAHGYKAHIAADKDSGIIRKVETTPANEPDVSIAPSIIPDKPGGENSASGILGGEVYADIGEAPSISLPAANECNKALLTRRSRRHRLRGRSWQPLSLQTQNRRTASAGPRNAAEPACNDAERML